MKNEIKPSTTLSKLRRWRHRWRRTENSNAGLTLLETLIAIIVIGLTVSAITPAFVLALATRVQSQRVEQALQVAQNEVDKARLIMELDHRSVDDPDTQDEETREDFLPRETGDDDDELDDVDAPDRFLSFNSDSCQSRATQPLENEACSVDIDGDDEADFAVQVYRVNSTPPDDPAADPNILPNPELFAFDLGVRVYAYEATKNPDDDGSEDVDVANLNTTLASVGLTSGPRKNEGSSYRSSPLAVVYTTIVNNEEGSSLCDYYEYLGDNPADSGLECDDEED